MQPMLHVSLILGIIVFFILIIFFLRNKALNLKYTLLWIASGLIMLIVLIFPQSMEGLSDMLGIASPTNAVFALGLFFLMTILMSITAIVSKQNEKSKRLIQHIALLEERIRMLEKPDTNKSADIQRLSR